MNQELATHISLLAAPIFAALLARRVDTASSLIALPTDPVVQDTAWRGLACIAAIGMARELWEATLKT